MGNHIQGVENPFNKLHSRLHKRLKTIYADFCLLGRMSVNKAIC